MGAPVVHSEHRIRAVVVDGYCVLRRFESLVADPSLEISAQSIAIAVSNLLALSGVIISSE